MGNDAARDDDPESHHQPIYSRLFGTPIDDPATMREAR
ncbi:hypothetical protein MA6G0728R_5420 [Mycobacteroides abscessus 6G-0728-R]|nr:hypothetical protein MA6G0125S_5341 [Mycobacteroides abscessus 6G-0125-S]EIU64252.1 hypothetical protein MA6G0728S_5393 [Mycobacteroides abscessus 6G-0728-S]EIV03116.1 hypothetical protein MA6G0728R_5420 [Mycobacteroides abscessus 6G-0728-R]